MGEFQAGPRSKGSANPATSDTDMVSYFSVAPRVKADAAATILAT